MKHHKEKCRKKSSCFNKYCGVGLGVGLGVGDGVGNGVGAPVHMKSHEHNVVGHCPLKQLWLFFFVKIQK